MFIVLACAVVSACAADLHDHYSLLQTQVKTMPGESGAADGFEFLKKDNVRQSSGGIVRLLDFTQAKVVTNNLGGQGPQKQLATGGPAPKELRFRNLVGGLAVDLVVTAEDGYQAYNPSRNGILAGNGQVNARSGTTANMTYSFMQEGTNIPYVMPKFYMTFSDIDERHGGKESETIFVTGYTKYYTNDDLKIVDNGNAIPTFASSDYGNYEDNTFSPDSPDPTQLSHAVTYLFTDTASFNAVYTIEEHRDFHKGRNILFSGISQLVFCQESSTTLDFKSSRVTVNNLGGKGPELNAAHELRWSNIATKDGVVLDLVATVDEGFGYNTSNVSNNGLHGDFGSINLFCGPTETDSEAIIGFRIVRTGTTDPVILDQFAIVMFDFDSGLHEQQIEFVDMPPGMLGFQGGAGYSSYIVTDTTEVVISDRPDGKKRFMASKHGTESDNPTSAQNLARETADKSVVFTFRGTASFQFTLGITPAGFNSGRNFLFSGQDMYSMCD